MINFYDFNTELAVKQIVQWIKDWFADKNPDSKAVVGMSGGKDSTITAALLVQALGKNRVIGVALPQGEQSINGADKICEYLGIEYMCVNIGAACDAIVKGIHDEMDISSNTVLNIPPRVRMTTLYGIAQSIPGGGFVSNNCNFSEDFLGYSTIFGDLAGAFSVLSGLTVSEIIKIGLHLGLPTEWVCKVPDDGLPGSTSDEKKFGFLYSEVDAYIREMKVPEGFVEGTNELKMDKIKQMYKNSSFKRKSVKIDHYEPRAYVLYKLQR